MTEGLGKKTFLWLTFQALHQAWELGLGEKRLDLETELVTVICPEKLFFPLDYLRNLA